jgi:hypothetical protein
MSAPPVGTFTLRYEGPLPQAPCCLITRITIYGVGKQTLTFELGSPRALSADEAALVLAVPLPEGLGWHRQVYRRKP